MVRTSEEDIKRMEADFRNPLAAKPGPDVPAACAAFFGGWTGTWAQANQGQQSIWIVGIRPDCTFRFSFRVTSDLAPPSTFPGNGEIKGNSMTIRCGTQVGTCSFQNRGDRLWASYVDASGNLNNGVFQKMER